MATPQAKEYDIIFAGGGTAACVAAGRLAKANPDLSILLVELGPNNLNNPMIRTPAFFLAQVLPTSPTTLFYEGKKSEHLNGRAPMVQSGGTLGGGSSINFLSYTRGKSLGRAQPQGQSIDYDSWKAEGWDTKSLMPYARKLENFCIDKPGINNDIHGRDGPIQVTYTTYDKPGPQKDVLAAAAALGYGEVPDLQDFESVNSFSRWAQYIGKDGKRQDTAHCYIHPLMASGEAPKLEILVETRVDKVTFADGKASGIVCLSAKPGATDEEKTPFNIKASKLVVVAAGALGTPSILERSGLGGEELLKSLDIPVVSNLPGVGEQYQDHLLMMYPYRSTLKPDESLDIGLTDPTFWPSAVQNNDPVATWNGLDLISKLRPSEAEVDALGADFKALWQRDFQNSPTKPLGLIASVQAYGGEREGLTEADGKQFLSFGVYSAYPYARGHIHIAAADPSTPASFETGFLSHPFDLSTHVWGYKKHREVARRTNAYIGELAQGHPKFPAGSAAGVVDVDPHVARGGDFKSAEERKAVENIVYTKEDDAAIEDWVREKVATTWHSLGTCKMAPRESGGVVDTKLNVYGVEGLKCMDLSIVPENVGANTNHTAMLIGEKGADIIAGELGLKI